MRDFLRFLRHLLRTIHFIRAIVVGFVVLLILCMVAVSVAEDMPFSQAVYFVLVTALTIGYGDITPKTPWGQVSSLLAGVLGLLVTGIVVAATVHALTKAIHDMHQDNDLGDD
ncbi:MAG: potassium channel family protein [Planctomycetota bacterium]|jgi:voltage-gated potassium channel